jgi:hypothetical protein
MPSRWLSLIRERSNSAKAPMTEGMKLAVGESSPVTTRLSLTNSTRAPLRASLDESTGIIEVSGEPVHALNYHSVPIAGEPHKFRELWPSCVVAGFFYASSRRDHDVHVPGRGRL